MSEAAHHSGGRVAQRRIDAALCALFAALLLLPALDDLLGLDPTPPRQQEPPVQWTQVFEPGVALTERVARAQELAAIRFGFRDALVALNGVAHVQWLGVSSTHDVALGREGWLFHATVSARESGRNLRPFPARVLESARDHVVAQKGWLARRGAHYLLVIVPSKDTVYAGHRPAWETRVGAQSRLDQLAGALASAPEVAFLDLRPAMSAAARERGFVYQKLDTHWNELGAHAAYEAIVQRLSIWFPELRAQRLDDFELHSFASTQGDLARMLGLRGFLSENLPRLRPRSTPRALAGAARTPVREYEPLFEASFGTRVPGRADLPTALVFRDSFGDLLFPLLAEHFRAAAFIWHDGLDVIEPAQRVIDRAKPQVVIHQLGERVLMRVGEGYDAPAPER